MSRTVESGKSHLTSFCHVVFVRLFWRHHIFSLCLFPGSIPLSEAYSKLIQTSKMKLFGKIVNGFHPLRIVAKSLIHLWIRLWVHLWISYLGCRVIAWCNFNKCVASNSLTEAIWIKLVCVPSPTLNSRIWNLK